MIAALFHDIVTHPLAWVAITMQWTIISRMFRTNGVTLFFWFWVYLLADAICATFAFLGLLWFWYWCQYVVIPLGWFAIMEAYLMRVWYLKELSTDREAITLATASLALSLAAVAAVILLPAQYNVPQLIGRIKVSLETGYAGFLLVPVLYGWARPFTAPPRCAKHIVLLWMLFLDFAVADLIPIRRDDGELYKVVHQTFLAVRCVVFWYWIWLFSPKTPAAVASHS